MSNSRTKFLFLGYLILLLAAAISTEDQTFADSGNVAENETSTSENSTTARNFPSSTTTQRPILPPQGSEEMEHKSSMAIFLILSVIVVSILMIHMLIITKIHYVPESLAIVVIGTIVGAVLKYLGGDNWRFEEAFSPNAFFLILLPPIIFESGYNMHKGNFFANIGSILVFAILGTGISALVMGGGIFVLGEADLIFKVSAVDSFAFGSLISAVDPVATLAIFQALDVDPILYMLVFGESVLNDAVAIVLTETVTGMKQPNVENLPIFQSIFTAVGRFCLMFFGSAAFGVLSALISAFLLKYIDLRKTPSLEFSLMLVFAYLPYGFAEGIHLSGIMAILFCGIVMSHYTHFNLSPTTQITMQLVARTMAFMAETCTFAYLGMAFFTFPLKFEPVFVIWSIVLLLVSRAFNIFPLSLLVNFFREHKITKRMQFIMWFSGLRGAIAFALALHTDLEPKARNVVVTSTLVVVIFTIVVLGGSTMPLVKFLSKSSEPNRRRRKRRRRSRTNGAREKSKRRHTLIKAQTEIGSSLDTDYFTEVEEQKVSQDSTPSQRLRGFARIEARYLRPFFVRKFTAEEKLESTQKLTDAAIKWYREVESEDDEEKLIESDIDDGIPLITPQQDGIPLIAVNHLESDSDRADH